jgi:hypothetical protein
MTRLGRGRSDQRIHYGFSEEGQDRKAPSDPYLAFYVIFFGLAGTAENSGMSPSGMVGWVKMASRNAV